MKYDIVLREKPFISGLTKDDVIELFSKVDGEEAYPIEIYAKYHESSAMGFITPYTASLMECDYDVSGLRDFIAEILDDMALENEKYEYEFKGIKIWLDR